jgi:hypothetical protein
VTQTLLGLATDALHDDFDTTKYATRAKGFVATAVDMVYRTTSLARGDYSSSQTLAAGAGSLSVAVTGLRVSSVSLTDTGELLNEVPADDLVAAQAAATAAHGRPRLYALTGLGPTTAGSSVLFYPVPVAAVTVEITGRYVPTRLSADSDVVPLPDDYLDIPVAYARGELFALEDDPQMSQFWMDKYRGRLSDLRGDLAQRSMRNRRIAGTWSDVGVPAGPTPPLGW